MFICRTVILSRKLYTILILCLCLQAALALPGELSLLETTHSPIMSTVGTPDAIVVGSGLAGLTAALNILDRGGKVVLLEKEAKPGGNSMKASSGINACITSSDGTASEPDPDEVAAFVRDTLKSAGDNANPQLVETLVHNSASALRWLKDRVGVDLLENRTQLGGHSSARTHRPAKGAVGFTVMSAMQKALKSYEESGHLEIRLSTRVTNLLSQQDSGATTVVGVECVTTTIGNDENGNEEAPPTTFSIHAPHVILATGGFAADRSSDSFLASYCPEYLKMPATFGDFSTGDGIKFATALGAGTCLMEKVQVHPTGFVDPADPDSPSKFLCAELMRGLGGILLNSHGQRFCNELGTRSYITDQMLRHEPHYAATGKWDASLSIPTFTLVLSAEAAKAGGEHIGFYAWKKLLQPYKGIAELAKYTGVSSDTLKSTIEEYRQQAEKGGSAADPFGKTFFPNAFTGNLDEEEFYAGTVTPVLHYCMGGLTTDQHGNVLNHDNNIIHGLHAAGEVAGGVHGDNRLAGNSLLECLVFGTIIGKTIPIVSPTS